MGAWENRRTRSQRRGAEHGQFSEVRITKFQKEGLESWNYCLLRPEDALEKVQSSQGLIPFFQLELLNLFWEPYLRDPQSGSWTPKHTRLRRGPFSGVWVVLGCARQHPRDAFGGLGLLEKNEQLPDHPNPQPRRILQRSPCDKITRYSCPCFGHRFRVVWKILKNVQA